MTLPRLRLGLLCALLASPLAALDIGEKAPALADAVWIKDVPVQLTGMISVVEFWSTTATSDSFTHLSELQHTLRDRLQVIGVSSEAASVVNPFVEGEGGDMDYHVAIIGAATAASWMPEKEELPRIFIVDRQGRLAWRGDPGDLDSILDRILAGTLDTALLARLAPLQDEIDTLIDGDHANGQERKEKALDLTKRCLALDPINLKAIVTRLWLAEQLQHADVALATLSAVPLATLGAADANAIALDRLAVENPLFRLPELAYAFSLRARMIDPEKAAYRDTYARFLVQAGMLAEAIAEQKSAVALNPEDDTLVAMLEYYQTLQTLRPRLADDITHLPANAPVEAHEAVAAPAPAPVPAPAGFIP